MTPLLVLLRPTLLHLAILGGAGEEGSARRRVYSVVQTHPGLHQSDVARQVGMIPSHAEHHLHQLEKAGLVHRDREGGFVRYYVTVVPSRPVEGAVGRHERPRLALLRHARPLEIVAHLLLRDEWAMGDLAQAVRLSPGALTYQVKRLESVGLVRRRAESRSRFVSLVDRDDTIALLLRYEPPADLVASFESLWDEVGF